MKTPGYEGIKPRAGRLMAGGRGFEPRLTDSESAVLPLDEPPNVRGILSHAQEGVYSTSAWVSKRAIARSIRARTSTLPITAMLSISGGLTRCPVTATRKIPNN